MFCQVECLRRFLIAQDVLHLIPNIQIVTTILHPLWLYIFVYIFDLSLEGVAIASTITNTLNLVTAYIIIEFKQSMLRDGSWNYINKDSFKGL